MNISLPLAIIQNLSYIKCVKAIKDDRSLEANIVLFMEHQYGFDTPVITTGLDEFKKSILFKHLYKKRLQTSKHIFWSSSEDMSTKNMRHFSELKKDTIFANLSSGQITVGEFKKYEVKPTSLGSCSNFTLLNETISRWQKNRKRWEYRSVSVCYSFDPPFTMNHSSLRRKGMILDIHEMIHDLIGIKPNYKKFSLKEKGKKRRTQKILQNLMRGRVCDYFLQGTLGRLEKEYDFTTPSFTDYLFWYAPTDAPVPKWKYVYQILTKEVWFFWVLTVSTSFLFWYFAAILLKTFKTEKRFFEKLWYLYKLAVEQDVLLKPYNTTETIIIFALIVQSFVMNIAYKCKFVQFLSNDNYENQLNSLEDAMELGLNIGFLPLLSNLFEHDEELKRYLKNHYVPCDFSFNCIDRSANSKDLVVLRARKKMWYTAKRYTVDGKSKLKKIGSVVCGMTFNSIFRRGHPLYPLVEKALLDLLAHGFVQKVSSNYVRDGEVKEEPKGNQTLTLKHLQLSFLILVSGLASASILFLLEVLSTIKLKVMARKLKGTFLKFKK